MVWYRFRRFRTNGMVYADLEGMVWYRFRRFRRNGMVQV